LVLFPGPIRGGVAAIRGGVGSPRGTHPKQQSNPVGARSRRPGRWFLVYARLVLGTSAGRLFRCFPLGVYPLLVCLAMTLTAAGVPSAFAAKRCHRQIPNGPSIALGATYIAKYEGMTCQFARKVVLTADKRGGYTRPLYGLRCHHLNINAGGGGEVCKSPHRLLELLFE
jgi:hypothetical protein